MSKPTIERIERYCFDGQEFRDLPAVAKYVENEIGKVIDSTPNRLHPRDAVAVFDSLVRNRERLCLLLSASFCTNSDELQSDKQSIFTV